MTKKKIDVLAATPLQEGLLALHRLGSGSDPYHVQFVFRIDGALDASLLERCAQQMLVRHPNLRVAFYDTNVAHPVQVVPPKAKLDWEVITPPADFADDVDAGAAAFAAEDFPHPFDLFKPAPLRLRLLRWNPHCHHLVLTAHHIIIDGWSAPLFFAELMGMYRVNGRAELLPKVPPYRNYIAWLSQKTREESLEVWRSALAPDAPDASAATTPAADAPSTKPNPTLIAPQAPTSPGGAPVTFNDQLDTETTYRLMRWCQDHNLTLSNAVLFAWGVVLGALVDRDDLITGTVVSGRPADLPGAENMIGLFINTVPARIRLRPDVDAATQAQALRDSLLQTRPHEHVGLSDIQRHLGTRDLFDTLVVHQNTPRGAGAVSEEGGFRITPLATNDSTHYPLTIVPAVVDGELRIKVEARADLVDAVLPAATAEIATAMARLLAAFPSSDGVPLAQLGTGFSTPTIPYAPAADAPLLPELVRDLVAEDPDAPALIDASGTLTRRDFLNRAMGLATLLSDAHLHPGDRVGLLLSRTAWQPTALLACAWLGVTAVQLDAAAPPSHNLALLEQAGVAAVISDVEIDTSLRVVRTGDVVGVDKQPLDAAHPDAPLYIVFTSGSTGQPKGVVGAGRGIAALIAAHKQLVLGPAQQRLGRQLTVGHAWSMAFDASWQPLTALFAGQTVAILDENEQRDPELYAAALGRHGVDFIETSPTMFSQLQGSVADLDVLGLGGEAIDPAVWSGLAGRERPRAYNFYGPTETTVDAVAAALGDYAEPCIGTPLPGMHAQVLDRWLRPVPAGTPGELYLSGPQVALGYSGRPDLTASHFVAFADGSRAYRTGDIVCFDADTGGLRYLGRVDDQIKIRGFRVEPAQVLRGVLGLPQVTDARVQVVTREGVRSLIAVVLVADPALLEDPAATSAQLISQLRNKVAAHLVPSAIIAVPEFPLTQNGKIDLAALPAIVGTVTSPPEGKLEIQLAGIVSRLTGVNAVDRDTDIRDLGMDSIMLMQLGAAAGALEDPHPALSALTPRLVLENPTVRGIAAGLMAADAHAAEDPGVGTFTPTPIQRWLIDHMLADRGGQRFSQWALLDAPAGTTAADVEALVTGLLSGHGMLRAGVDKHTGEITIPADVPPSSQWLMRAGGTELSELIDAADTAMASINPLTGDMLRAVWLPERGQLLLLVHHLAVDGASWRALLGPGVSGEATSFHRWAELLAQRAADLDVSAVRQAWADYLAGADTTTLGARAIDPAVDRAADAISETVLTDADALVSEPSLHNTLLAALSRALRRWRGIGPVAVDLEGHGRELSVLNDYGHPGDDLSNTAGWFTTVTPTLLADTAADVASSLAAQPSSPVDYSLACGISTGPAEIEVNYLGRLDAGAGSGDTAQDSWRISQDRAVYDALPEMPDPDLPRTYAIEVTFAVVPGDAGPQLSAHFNLAAGVFSSDDLRELCQAWEQMIGQA